METFGGGGGGGGGFDNGWHKAEVATGYKHEAGGL